MKKLYTEEIYEQYLEFLERIANEDVITENVRAYTEMRQFLSDNKVSKEAEDQMDTRMMKEENGEIPKLKRLK